MVERSYTIHVDIDSPVTLADFYNVQLADYDLARLEAFYEKTFERMLDTYDALGIQTTFFCVASEIERSAKIRDVIRSAISRGHFIANHTYTHPFGLNELSHAERQLQVQKANAILERELGVKPLGFRSPGYAIDTGTVNLLEQSGLAYDSSSGWAVFHVIFKTMRFFGMKTMKVGFGETNSRLRANMYVPSGSNWKKKSRERRGIREYPLPASFYVLPCYSNLHLTFGLPFVKLLLNHTKRNKLLVYLMHAIEFSSAEDNFIPPEILVHPHVKMKMEEKLGKIRSILEYIDSKRKKFSIESDMMTVRSTGQVK
jgi:peptidoglycan/xylan/chitin deacetylase (PgdA/CDA1 family)